MMKIVEHTIIMSLQSNEAKKHRQIKGFHRQKESSIEKLLYTKEGETARHSHKHNNAFSCECVCVYECGGALVKRYVTQHY